MAMIDDPVITATAIGPGHDGRAEIVVSVRYRNGAIAQLSLDQEVVERALIATSADDLADLHGQSWSVLFPTLTSTTTQTTQTVPPVAAVGSPNQETSTCST